MSRRKFLKDLGLISTSLYTPGFLSCNWSKKMSTSRTGKNLVVIQLSGGNDGFNCLFPYRMDDYYKLRPSISLKRKEVEYLNDEYAVNRELLPLKKYFDKGEMNIINRVGYPNPYLSHFRSMDIWHTASTNVESVSSGWLGRYMDKQCNDQICDLGINVEDGLNLALRGMNTMGIAVGQNPSLTEKMYRIQQLNRKTAPSKLEAKNLQYLYKIQDNSINIHKYIGEEVRGTKISKGFQKDLFSKKMGYVTKMILRDLPSKVYYLEVKGFDTHSNQKTRQNKLLSSLSYGIDQFIRELKSHHLFEDTLIFVFSEFGRRLAENKSKGTDHGTGNCSFILGGSLKIGGIYNEMFSGTNIVEKNLAYEIDFRSIYATILEKWLEVDSKPLLGNNYQLLNFLS